MPIIRVSAAEKLNENNKVQPFGRLPGILNSA
jgi:hypothetical protein